MSFKHIHIKSLLISSLFVFASACINSETPRDQKPAPTGFVKTETAENLRNLIEKEERKSSFFIVGQAKGKVVGKITSVDGDSKDVRALKYEFEVCIGDKNAPKNLLQKFNFRIEGSTGENPTYSSREETDERGCLVWTESISFDISKQNPQPIVFMRKIKSVEGSSRSGMTSFLFQLFPWDEVLQSQSHPVFYHLRGNERYNHSSQIISLMQDDSYNPKDHLMSLNGEEGKLFVKKVGYDLTAFPFSLIKKDAQPTGTEILSEKYTKDSSVAKVNYVTLPDGKSDKAYWDQKRIEQGLPLLSDLSDPESNSNPAFDGLKVNLVLKVNLAQSYAGLNGLQPRDVRSGRFKILPYIYASDYNSKGERVLLNPGMEALEAVVDLKGDLNLIYEGVLPFAPTSGRVELALKIVPMDTNASKYKTVEEIFTVGNYDDLIGTNSRAWENPKQFNEDFDFNKYAKESTGYEAALADSSIKIAEPYSYSLAGVRFKTIDPGETANRRTVIFNVNTCVNTINFNAKVLEGKEFEVVSRHFKTPEAEKIDETLGKQTRNTSELKEGVDYKDRILFSNEDERDKIKTDSRGCLNFIDKINHKYYQTERLVRRKYFIKAKNDAFTKELVLYLNPWDEKFGTLGTDSRSVSQTFLNELNDRKKIVPRFFIKDYGYETLRFRYEIDKNMNLDVKKTVLLRMRPLVLRYSNVLQGINSIHDLRDGIYLLKVAYQKDYLDPAAKGIRLHSGLSEQDGKYVLSHEAQIEKTSPDGETVIRTDRQSEKDKADAIAQGEDIDGSLDVVEPYDPSRKTAISIVKKLVRINAGNVVTPIEFGVDDLRLLRIRGQFFTQIEPINQTRLQIVNMASRKIEEVLALKKGKESELSKLPVAEQREIIQKKMAALDTLALNIPDNIEYSVKDPSELLAVFEKPEVITAFSYFMPGGLLGSVEEMLMRGDPANYIGPESIYRAMKTEKDFALKMTTLNDEINAQNSTVDGVRNHSTTIRKTPTGKKFLEYNYESDAQFKEICGEKHLGFESCVATNKEKNASFDENLCRCYDESSKDYAPMSTKEGDALTTVEEIEAEIRRLREAAEFQKANDLLADIKKNSAEFFKGLTSEEALVDLLLNDFTLAQAESDISDLNLLKDRNYDPTVDINPRTFVGPLTFLRNSNSGSLRPTDNLDEAYCVTDDCNSLGSDPLSKYGAIQNFDYERSPYHGSIAHFENMTVDGFIEGAKIKVGNKEKQIPSYTDFKENKAKVNGVKALLSNFVEEFNLNYVSLKDKKLKKFVCANPEQVNFETGECLEDYTERHWSRNHFERVFKHYSQKSAYTNLDNKVGMFASFYKGKLDPKFDMDFLKGIIQKDHGGKACTKKVVPASYAKFSKNEYAKFCSLMTYGVLKKSMMEIVDDYKKRAKSGEISQSYFKNMMQTQLLELYDRKDGAWIPRVNSFIFPVYKSCLQFAELGEGNEPLYIERKYRIEDTGRYYYLGGKSLNINLSQNVGISHSTSAGKSHNFNPSKLITSWLPKQLDLYGYSYTKNENLSASEGTSVSQGTFLVMQNAEFDVELKKYEQCMVIRWAENLKVLHRKTFYDNMMIQEAHDSNVKLDNGKYLSQHMVDKLGEGLMICSGDVEDTPIAVRETYYYFTQHFTEGDMQDRADIHNHPWLLSLRGVREYETFLAATHADHDVTEEEAAGDYVHAHELIGMKKMMESDKAAALNKNLDGTSFEAFDKYKRNGWPLTQLVRTYRKISPTFPGLYTQLSRREYQVDQWPWIGSQAGDNFNNHDAESNAACKNE